MAALVERQTMVIGAQGKAAQVPGMRGQRATVQEQDRRLALGPPIEIAQTQAIDRDAAFFGQDHVVEAETGAQRSRSQMVAVFFARQAHPLATPSKIVAATAEKRSLRARTAINTATA